MHVFTSPRLFLFPPFLQAAVELKPDLCEAYLNAGTIVDRQGDYEKVHQIIPIHILH